MIAREFLGWDQPALPMVVNRLAARYRQGRTFDLAKVVIVVPGQRAGRRLQELLAYFAEDEKLVLTPPRVTTEGKLPEILYTPKKPFASNIVQEVTWSQALRSLPVDELLQLTPQPPAPGEALRWLHLGSVVRRLHVELAAEGLDFAAVRARAPRVPGFTDAARWQTLVALQRRYHDLLDRQNLWDIQTARLKAIEYKETKTECDIFLVGTVDLNQSLRQMLDQVAEHVTALVIAPPELAESFDAHGCLQPHLWRDVTIPLTNDQLQQVDGLFEQTGAVAAWLSELGGRFRKDEIAIGVPDEGLAPQLQRELTQHGVRCRWVEGAQLRDSGPYRLLAAATAFSGPRRYEDLSALIRHPDIEAWLGGQLPRGLLAGRSLPAQMDRYYNAHLPGRVQSTHANLKGEHWPALAPALKRIEHWLDAAASPRPLRAWGALFRQILAAVYGERTLNLDVPTDEVMHRTLNRMLEACSDVEQIPETLEALPLSASDAFTAVLDPLASEPLPPPADPEALELLGWLELPLDDSPALVVTSFNEGVVPTSAGADVFLPDRLRRELGLLHNERRYARDAYAVSVLCHSRRELRMIFARHDQAHDPLQPSRLIFACSDEPMTRRALKYFGPSSAPSSARRPSLAGVAPIPATSQFTVPAPLALPETLTHISVTRFKSYLACPYRYYLQHVQQLAAIDDAARELDGAAFGTLIHNALCEFGRDPHGPRASSKEREIAEFVIEEVKRSAREIYGSQIGRAAIRLQIEIACQRLQAFASEQASLAQQGWRIVFAEQSGDTLSVHFGGNGASIKLQGRIDRMDYHEQRRTLRILDYKTANLAEAPERTHRRNDAWIDLQLPLYRHLRRAVSLGIPENCAVELAYFNLPRKREETKLRVAEWDTALLESADAAAREVIRKIRAAEFWPPRYPPPDHADAFAAICMDNACGGPPLSEDIEEGGPS